jgi:hypothetical protein
LTALHVGEAFALAGHANWAPHPPQLFGSVVVLTSQPLPALPSQSANGALQEPTPQALLLQPGVPFATAGHTVPQPPQLFLSVLVSTHAPPPLRVLALQSVPELHEPTHWPPVHASVPPVGALQLFPQTPQF